MDEKIAMLSNILIEERVDAPVVPFCANTFAIKYVLPYKHMYEK
jgi:hypothetical protein